MSQKSFPDFVTPCGDRIVKLESVVYPLHINSLQESGSAHVETCFLLLPGFDITGSLSAPGGEKFAPQTRAGQDRRTDKRRQLRQAQTQQTVGRREGGMDGFRRRSNRQGTQSRQTRGCFDLEAATS